MPSLRARLGRLLPTATGTGSAGPRSGPASTSATAPRPAPAPPPDDLDAAFAAAAAAIRAGDVGPARTLAERMLRQDVRTPAIAVRVAILLDPVVRPDAALLALRGRARRHAGEPTLSLADLRASLASRDDPALRRQTVRIEGELRSLSPDWPRLTPRSDRPPAATTPAAPTVPGRILHLVSSSRPWVQHGFAIRTHEIARAQLAAGLEPHLATPPGFPGRRGGRGAPVTEQLDGVTYHRLLPDHPADDPLDVEAALMAEELRRLAGSLGPVAIDTSQGPTLPWATCGPALAVARDLGLPCVVEVRAFREEVWKVHAGGGPLRPRAGQELARLLAAKDLATWQAADQVVALGEVMRDEIVGRGVPATKVSVVPNAVDEARFTPGPRDPALAARLGIHDGEVVVGHVGGLAPWEGLDLLVAAVGVLRERGRPVRLLLVGDGAVGPALRAQVAALRLADVVTFTGQVPHAGIVPHLRLMDLFVVPRTDSLLTRLVTPIKPVEAMVVGLPLVVSDLPALRELVTDGVTGRTAPAGDPDGLAEVLDALVLDPDARARLASAGRAWALGERTLAANARRYLEIHRRIGAV